MELIRESKAMYLCPAASEKTLIHLSRGGKPARPGAGLREHIRAMIAA